MLEKWSYIYCTFFTSFKSLFTVGKFSYSKEYNFLVMYILRACDWRTFRQWVLCLYWSTVGCLELFFYVYYTLSPLLQGHGQYFQVWDTPLDLSHSLTHLFQLSVNCSSLLFSWHLLSLFSSLLFYLLHWFSFMRAWVQYSSPLPNCSLFFLSPFLWKLYSAQMTFSTVLFFWYCCLTPFIYFIDSLYSLSLILSSHIKYCILFTMHLIG